MIARMIRPTDFERVLGTRNRANSAHFAVHHLSDRPSLAAKSRQQRVSPELSTGGQQVANRPVDDLAATRHLSVGTDEDKGGEDARVSAAASIWLGAVVPKRHARRSVTRTMLKRQIRAAIQSNAEYLADGLWVVRLRAPFDRANFVSASSSALRRVARDELDLLIRKAAQRTTAA